MLQTSAWLQRQSSQEDEFLHFEARVQHSNEIPDDGSGDTNTLFHGIHTCLQNLLIGSVIIIAHHTLLTHQSRSPVSASFSTRQTTAATTANLSPHFGLQRKNGQVIVHGIEQTLRRLLSLESTKSTHEIYTHLVTP